MTYPDKSRQRHDLRHLPVVALRAGRYHRLLLEFRI